MPSATNIPSADIPVIDISSSNADAAAQVLAAAANNGFVFVENNSAGIPANDIENMFELSREFFDSPMSVKQECLINSNKSGKNRGWLSMGTERLDPSKQKKGDFKEAFNIGEPLPNQEPQPLPAVLEAQRRRIDAFSTSCHALCNRVLDLFALALALPDSSWFSSRHDQSIGASGSVLRLLYYPAPPADSAASRDETDIRAGAHSDYGSVTLLFQLPGQPGLEILTPDGQWAAVPPDPNNTGRDSLPILVNIGDLLSYWTNGLLKSTVHRVIFPKDVDGQAADRYSMAYFCHPLDEAELVPVPSEVVRRYKEENGNGLGVDGAGVLTARDHLNQRLAATYGVKK